MTENICFAKLKIFPVWPYREKSCLPPVLRTKDELSYQEGHFSGKTTKIIISYQNGVEEKD